MLKIELVSVDLQSPPDPLNPEVKLGLITLQWNITCPLVLVVYVLLLLRELLDEGNTFILTAAGGGGGGGG